MAEQPARRPRDQGLAWILGGRDSAFIRKPCDLCLGSLQEYCWLEDLNITVPSHYCQVAISTHDHWRLSFKGARNNMVVLRVARYSIDLHLARNEYAGCPAAR